MLAKLSGGRDVGEGWGSGTGLTIEESGMGGLVVMGRGHKGVVEIERERDIQMGADAGKIGRVEVRFGPEGIM